MILKISPYLNYHLLINYLLIKNLLLSFLCLQSEVHPCISSYIVHEGFACMSVQDGNAVPEFRRGCQVP